MVQTPAAGFDTPNSENMVHCSSGRPRRSGLSVGAAGPGPGVAVQPALGSVLLEGTGTKT